MHSCLLDKINDEEALIQFMLYFVNAVMKDFKEENV